jgi:hypothetical protein
VGLAAAIIDRPVFRPVAEGRCLQDAWLSDIGEPRIVERADLHGDADLNVAPRAARLCE